MPSFDHSGGNAGKTYYIGYENGDGAVIMTSGDGGGWLWPEILRSISRVYHWSTWTSTQRSAIAVTTSELVPYIGKFTAPQLGEIEIAVESGHLRAMLSYYGSSALFASVTRHITSLERMRPMS